MIRTTAVLFALTVASPAALAQFEKPTIDVTFQVEDDLRIKASMGDDFIDEVRSTMRQMVPARFPFLELASDGSNPYTLAVTLVAAGESQLAKNLEFVMELKPRADAPFGKFAQPKVLKRQLLPGEEYRKFIDDYDLVDKKAEVLEGFWEKLDDSLTYWCLSKIPLAPEVYILPDDSEPVAILPFDYGEIGARASVGGEALVNIFDVVLMSGGRVKKRKHCFLTPLEGEVDVTGLPEAENYADCIVAMDLDTDAVGVTVATFDTEGEDVEAQFSGVPLGDLFGVPEDGAEGYRSEVEGVFIINFVPEREPSPFSPDAFSG